MHHIHKPNNFPLVLIMGSQCSKQIKRRKSLAAEKKILHRLQETYGSNYPGSDHRPIDRKNWMSGLDPQKVKVNKIVWPGTHDSATNKIGIMMITRPFAQCQSLSVYQQLVRGARILDIRVEENAKVCHGILTTYGVDVVIEDIKKFIYEQLGELLIHQDDCIFDKTIAEILPKRIICVWKPCGSSEMKTGGPFWSSGYLKDNWINTDLPATKFESNLKHLSQQKPIGSRKYFYRVENTVTPKADNPVVCVRAVTNRIHGHGRLFIAQCFERNCADRLQIFSIDFINEDFVDACVGLTKARIEGKA